MSQNTKLNGPGKKGLIALICTVGLLGTAYGMVRENNPVFLFGLLFVIIGYLLIRRRLKASMVSREEEGRGDVGPGS